MEIDINNAADLVSLVAGVIGMVLFLIVAHVRFTKLKEIKRTEYMYKRFCTAAISLSKDKVVIKATFLCFADYNNYHNERDVFKHYYGVEFNKDLFLSSQEWTQMRWDEFE